MKEKVGGTCIPDFRVNRWCTRSSGNIEAAMAGRLPDSGDKIQRHHESSRGIRYPRAPSPEVYGSEDRWNFVVDEGVQNLRRLRIPRRYPVCRGVPRDRASTASLKGNQRNQPHAYHQMLMKRATGGQLALDSRGHERLGDDVLAGPSFEEAARKACSPRIPRRANAKKMFLQAGWRRGPEIGEKLADETGTDRRAYRTWS